MNTHVEMLVLRLERAGTFAELLRGVRRSRMVARAHGVSWRLLWRAAVGHVRADRARMVVAPVGDGRGTLVRRFS